MAQGHDSIQPRFFPQWLADIVQTIGSARIAVAASFGLVLDNLIPGTRKEGGLEARMEGPRLRWPPGNAS